MFYYSPAAAVKKAGYGIVTDRFLCTVSALPGPEALTALWDVLRSDSSHLEDVLSIFAANGIAKIPPFALVELVDVATGSILLAVRGAGEVVVTGRDVGPYVGAGATTWVEGAAQNVSGLSVGFAGAPTQNDELPLLRGVVRTDRLSWLPGGVAAAATGRAAETGTHVEPTTEVAEDHTELPDWARPEAEAAPVPVEPSVAPPVSPVAPPPPPPAAADDDDVDRTVLGSRQSRPAAQEPEDKTVLAGSRRRTAQPSTLPPFELDFSSGISVDLGRTVLVGRKPKAPVGPPIKLVTVSSPTSEVSSNHAEFSAAAGGVVIRDADSTNGSIIRQPGKAPFLLRNGESITVAAQTEVDLGDGNVVVIRAV